MPSPNFFSTGKFDLRLVFLIITGLSVQIVLAMRFVQNAPQTGVTEFKYSSTDQLIIGSIYSGLIVWSVVFVLTKLYFFGRLLIQWHHERNNADQEPAKFFTIDVDHPVN